MGWPQAVCLAGAVLGAMCAASRGGQPVGGHASNRISMARGGAANAGGGNPAGARGSNVPLTLEQVYELSVARAAAVGRRPTVAIWSASEVAQLARITRRVHRSIRYGVGPAQVHSAADILARGEGHCGHFALLLAGELARAGWDDVRIVSFQGYLGTHALVELQDGARAMTLDATCNAIYLHGVRQLLAQPSLAEALIGSPPARLHRYWGPSLFRNAGLVSYLAGKNAFPHIQGQARLEVGPAGRWYRRDIPRATDGETGGTFGCRPGPVAATFRWKQPRYVACVSVVVDPRLSFPSDWRITVFRGREKVYSRRIRRAGPRAASVDAWLPAGTVGDRLQLDFLAFGGPQNRFLAKEIIVVGAKAVAGPASRP